MGLLKGMAFMMGVPVRPTTTRERARMYQKRTYRAINRQTNALQGEMQETNGQLEESNIHLAQPLSFPKIPKNQITTSQSSVPIEEKNETAEKSRTHETLEKIQQLSDLKDSGVLTADEFQTQKKQIIKSLLKD